MNYYARYRQLRYETRCVISLSPTLYLPLARLKCNSKDTDGSKVVMSDTDLVVEGFPRSGNTFVYFALQMSQPKPLKLAHHFHAPAQIMAAVRWGRPAMVIIRNPLDAVCSLLQRNIQHESMITPRQALRNWIRFYKSLLSYRHGFITATFNQTTSDFGRVIQLVNEQFGTEFKLFQHNQANVAACFRAIEERNMQHFGAGKIIESSIARPSAGRALKKEHILKALNVSGLEDMRKHAAEIYAYYADWAGDSCVTQSRVTSG
jgi:hypothetical protein